MNLFFSIVIGSLSGVCLILIYALIRLEHKYDQLLHRSIHQLELFQKSLELIHPLVGDKINMSTEHPMIYDSYVESDEPPRRDS